MSEDQKQVDVYGRWQYSIKQSSDKEMQITSVSRSDDILLVSISDIDDLIEGLLEFKEIINP